MDIRTLMIAAVGPAIQPGGTCSYIAWYPAGKTLKFLLFEEKIGGLSPISTPIENLEVMRLIRSGRYLQVDGNVLINSVEQRIISDPELGPILSSRVRNLSARPFPIPVLNRRRPA